MCRWITLLSAESVSLSDLILAPSNSLIHQSRDATYHPGYGALNNSPMNGDGFGVGWYHTNRAVYSAAATAAPSMDGARDAPANPTFPKPSPEKKASHSDHSTSATKAALFKDTFPAWNNQNLRELCIATSSDCVMAHVRAASPATGVSHQNCHPFKAGRLLYCHNGRVFGFSHIRRRLLEHVDDEAFQSIRGTTDSECVFGLILTFLAKDGTDMSPFHQTEPFGGKRLVAALKKTLWLLETVSQEAGTSDGYSTLNFSITDGETMVVTRFCDQSPEIPPPSLYFVFGEAKSLHKELTREEQLIPVASGTPDPSVHGSSGPEFTAKESDPDLSTSVERSETSSDTDSSYREQIISLEQTESKPGRVFADVDPATASFIVTSSPLTVGHVWHKMPQNSIMWCTRGTHPELRLLQRRKRHYSVVADIVNNPSKN